DALRAVVEVLSAHGLTIAKLGGQGLKMFFFYGRFIDASCKRKDFLLNVTKIIIIIG
ncbi:hypothetical protein ACJX0J_038200, partial [Zea mays]